MEQDWPEPQRTAAQRAARRRQGSAGFGNHDDNGGERRAAAWALLQLRRTWPFPERLSEVFFFLREEKALLADVDESALL